MSNFGYYAWELVGVLCDIVKFVRIFLYFRKYFAISLNLSLYLKLLNKFQRVNRSTAKITMNF